MPDLGDVSLALPGDDDARGAAPGSAPRAGSWRDAVARLRPGHRQLVLFLAVGVSNTILTYLTYLGLLLVVGYGLAYTGAFVVGLIYTGLLNIRVTFARHPTVAAFAIFAVYYLLYYLLNLALLRLVVEVLGIDKRLALLAMMPVIIPLNFFVTRLIAHRFGRARA